MSGYARAACLDHGAQARWEASPSERAILLQLVHPCSSLPPKSSLESIRLRYVEGDEHAPRRDRLTRSVRQVSGRSARSGRMAWIDWTGRAFHNHPNAIAAEAPGAQPEEHLGRMTRDSWLSYRIFKSCDAIVQPCRFAWNKLVDQPRRFMFFRLRQLTQDCSSMRVGLSPPGIAPQLTLRHHFGCNR